MSSSEQPKYGRQSGAIEVDIVPPEAGSTLADGWVRATRILMAARQRRELRRALQADKQKTASEEAVDNHGAS